MDAFAKAAAAAYAGHKATARKSGRRPEWPYVPVIDSAPGQYGGERVHAISVRGLAFATREEAVAAAERQLARMVAKLAERLREPHNRALREQHGLPTEI